MTVSRETLADPSSPLTPDGFAAALDVSCETMERLQAYASLLVKWQARINLVGPATLPDLWRRHFLDSAQVFPHLRPGAVLDLGSGAGFPGLILAILGAGPVHLVESDGRKCAFLREVARITETKDVQIHNGRIESLKIFPVTNVTARALAPLEKLLNWAEPFLLPDVQCLFLKGRGADEELTQAGENWMMRVERIPSLSDPSGLLLQLSEVRRGRD